MRRALSLVYCASLAFTAAPNAASAQTGPIALERDLTEWTNLSALSPGQMMEVVDRTSSKKHRGTFVGFDDAGISLRDASGEQTLRKQDVRSVKVRGAFSPTGHLGNRRRSPGSCRWVLGGKRGI